MHYLGLPVDMGRVLEIARRHDCFVVEDCAIALGATIDGAHVGLHGDIGCFSFYPVKHITTGEGGMVITRREDVAERVSKQRAFGIDKSVLADRRHTGAYEIEHLGLNYRLGEIGAAMGVEQMKRLPGFLEQRERNFELLSEGLSELDELTVLDSGHQGERRSSHYCLVAVLDESLRARRDRHHRVAEGRGRRDQRLLPEAALPIRATTATPTATIRTPIQWRLRSATARSRSRWDRTSRKMMCRSSWSPSNESFRR